MEKDFSNSWISSKKPNKQRKFRFKAPLHIRGNFLHSHLSKELRQKYATRALRVRVGDKVRIMRGQYKRQEGKVEEVDMKNLQLFIAKVEHTKRDGTKARHPIDPSNVLIVELNTDDKKRLAKFKSLKENKEKTQGQQEQKGTPNTEAKAEKKSVKPAPAASKPKPDAKANAPKKK